MASASSWRLSLAGCTVLLVQWPDLGLVQATLHPPPSVQTIMMRGIYMAYGVILIAYFPVAITGYLAFGNTVDPDVLLSVGKPAWLTRAANFMVVIHVGASWQVQPLRPCSPPNQLIS